jgi:hypothetical protein
VKLELVARYRGAQIGLHLVARVRLPSHLDIEEAVAVAALRLGPIERQVRLLDQLVGLGAVGGSRGNADAGADIHRVAFDVVGHPDDVDHALGKHRRRFTWVGLAGLNDGEFIAADPRQDVGLAQRRFEAQRRLLEQRVAGGMSERVVDDLEAVEIEDAHRERLSPAAQACPGLLDLGHEECPVGESGQQVVVCDVDNLRLGPFSFGDVGNHRQQVLRLAVGAVHDQRFDRDLAQAIRRGLNLVFVIGRPMAGLEQGFFVLEHPVGDVLRETFVRGSADDVVGGNTQELLSGAIEQDVTQALHVLHQDGRRQLVDHRLEEVAGLFQLDLRLVLLGDVLVGRHPTAARDRMVDRVHHAAVAPHHAPGYCLAARDLLEDLAAIHVRIHGQQARVVTMVQEIAQGAARLHDLG